MEVAGVASSHGVVAQAARFLNRIMVQQADGVVFIGRQWPIM